MGRLVNIFITMLMLLAFGTVSIYAQPKIKGNVYGGGENAKVMGQKLVDGSWVDDHGDGSKTTSVTINNGNVKGNVFGAGKGVTVNDTPATGTDGEGNTINPLTYDQIAVVYGNTEVNIDSTTTAPVMRGSVWGNIYGGAALAIVNGNTQVNIAGGKFASDVFGGGKGDVTGTNITAANVLKNTSVSVTAGEIIWDKKLNSNWEPVDAAVAEYFNKENNKFLTDHNIYAGGDIACTVGTWSDANTLSDPTTGTSSLTMTRGLLSGSLLSNKYWKMAFAEHENPHFYAFGGGYGIFTKAHKSDVNICMPMVSGESATGGDDQLARPRKTSGDPEPNLDIITDNYGVAWATVLGVLGGGYNGHVEETNVLVGDATYAHRVYGGGLGSYEGWTQSSEIATANSTTPNTPKAGYVGTTGKLPLTTTPADDLQTTKVTLAGGHIFGDVFGGGAGVAPRKLDGSTYTDFTEIARVKGNTKVETTSYKTYLTGNAKDVPTTHPNKDSAKDDNPLQQRAQIFGNVYGGGDVANVTGNTDVSLFGGDVFGYTFGAGLGRLITEAENYTSIGNVSGNSKVKIADLVDWPGDWKTDYVEPYKPTAWDDIYGGGRNGVTNGDAVVNINGGKVGNNIFGGGLGNVDGANITSADVKGNTTVTVNGGQYQWREIADVNGNKKTFIDNEVVTQSELLSRMGFPAKLEPVKDFFDYRTLHYTRDHSIYGGGNVACNVGTYNSDDKTTAATSGGTATVNMNHGLFADKDIMFTDEDFNIATLCRYLACENSENTQFGVFGGGYGANTKVSETKVNLNMGLESDNDKKLWAEYFGVIQNWYTALSDDDKKNLYGGSTGENAYNRYFTARMAKSINVPSHTVLTAAGGGLAGYVAGNTTVTMTGHSGALRVYGGGIGMKPEGIDALTDVAAAALTYGQVGGDTKVDVQAGVVVKNVYGGGAGVESQRKTGDSYVDFPGMAHVLGKTDVTVGGYSPGTVVFGKVYGGGDVANVGIKAGDAGETEVSDAQVVAAATGTTAFTDPQTKVTIDGGCVFQQVFAGGSGRTKNACNDYTKLGAVYGNSQLIIKNSKYTAEQAVAANLAGTLVDGWTNKSAGDTNEPWLWDVVYGGGQNGTVFGNTDVQILGGNLGYDIFGGGWGNKTASAVLGVDDITSADVTQNTNVRIAGGKWCLSQSWNGTERHWEPANVKGDKTYSSQYDPNAKKFSINHNVYGGGNVACNVGTYDRDGELTNSGGKTYVYVTKGMLVEDAALGHTYTNPGNLFAQPEWENIYDKHASPHFSVFGAGYGVDTKVDNTFVKVNMGYNGENYSGTVPSDPSIISKKSSAIFVGQQTLMDVIGGGYEGKVNNTCDVNIDGYTFMRNAFGGAYYAAVGNTNVNIVRANMDNVFGGGMMGDVIKNVNVTVGTEAVSPVSSDDAKSWNSNLIINEDVYGANDVAGYVGAESKDNGDIKITDDSKGVKIQLNGGHVFGSVYGGGNGDYLYLIDEDVSKVTVEDDYKITDDYTSTVYRVPLRSGDFPSLSAMSDQQKMVNVISFRPSTMKVNIDFKGNSSDDRLLVDGNIFGGGNSATITDFDGTSTGQEAKVSMNVGSHIKLGGVYLGSDGEALFESKKSYMTYFPQINNIQLYDNIDWTTPENKSIPIKFLPTPKENRPEIFKNNIDLYFMPVEMALMPEVTWGKARQNNSVNLARPIGDPLRQTYETVPESAEEGLVDAEIGTFCCGGNRGNMDTNTNFHINFPEGLTITDKIVGGCNNANYQKDIYDPVSMTVHTLDHTGGFLLGSHGVGTGRTPQIHLTLRNKFKITEKQTIEGVEYYAQKGNVFGGCYERGVVRGDILLEVYSNMLHSGRTAGGEICGLDSAMLRRTTDKGYTVASVYGAGYGPESWVRGDTEVRLGDETHPSNLLWNTDGTYNATQLASSCNYLFGGGRQGNVIGNTNVQVRNGRVAGCVVGASYAGTLYGSAQTIVGYPEVYYRAKKSRSYDILRADEDAVHATYLGDNGKLLIQKKVYYTRGDLVTATAYNGIRDRIVENKRLEAVAAHASFDKTAALTAAETELAAYFDKEHSIPKGNNWGYVNILIDKAIYGGGYALATGSGSYTVMKYTDEHKFLETDIERTYGFDGTLADNKPEDFTDYGGNTFVIVGDVSENYDVMAETATASLPPIPDSEKDHDHIRLSSSQLKEVALSIGDDLFGLFKELTNREAEPNKYDDYGGWDATPERIIEGKKLSGQYMKVTTEAPYTSEDRTNGNKFFEFVGEGGIYGDGRLSVSEGFRICDVIGYGYNGSTPKSPSLMNCIHRFDIARFKDCCISLLGDRDYTSAEGSQTNAVAYSMARVVEILMESAIDQRSNYKTIDKKHSRNYVGLSSAQFDLSAVKSNDAFTADYSEAALYHNKRGELISTTMDIEGTDDDFGGTAKKFPKQMSYYDVKKWYLSEYSADIEKSEYYDDQTAQVRNERQFQLRNSATARNMFGIFSGYALNVHSTHFVDGLPKDYYGPVVGVFEVDLIGTRAGEAGGYAYAQNIHHETTVDHDDNTVPTFLESSGNFVFPATEVRKVVDNCTPTAYNSVGRANAEGHYWYVTGFKYYYNTTITGYTYDGKTKFFESDNSTTKRLVLNGTKVDQTVVLQNFHWLPRHTDPYYKSADEYNAAWGTSLTESEFADLPEEKKAKCDIEHYYLTTKYNKDNVSGSPATDTDAWNNIITSDDAVNTPYYNLSLSLSEFGNYMEKTTDDVPLPYLSLLPQDTYHWSSTDPLDDERYKIYNNQTIALNNKTDRTNPVLGLRLADCMNNNGKDELGVSYYSKHLEQPCVAKIVLTTEAKNESGDLIYSAYSQMLPTTVQDDVRDHAAYAADPYYTIDINGDYKKIPTLDDAKSLVASGIYVFETQKDVYELVGSKAYNSSATYYIEDGHGGYTATDVTNESDFNDKKSNLWYLKTPAAHPENYVYDITLTIKYIKGPSYSGHIDIKNCALPGEMIRISHENLRVESDETSLPHNGSFWTIGPGRKVLNDPLDESKGYHWELIDETGVKERDAFDASGKPIKYYYNDPDTRNLYFPYNPYVNDPEDKFDSKVVTKQQDKAVSPIMRLGAYHDFVSTDKPDYFIPAYYFMNGYVAQYSFTVNGIDEVFTTTIHPEDTLLIHNYHRMVKDADIVDSKDDIKLSHAMKEYGNVPGIDADGLTPEQKTLMTAVWHETHKRPRVYIQDVDDFMAFAEYIKRGADETTDIPVLPHIDGSDTPYLPEYSAESVSYVRRCATQKGQDVEFFLMNDIDLTGESWTAIDFNGILHGNGHVIKGLDNTQSLFATLGEDVHIYNLGLPKGKIATGDSYTTGNPKYHCCYTFNTGEKGGVAPNQYDIHTVYRMNGETVTSYTEDDWRTGRVAYDLNEYYLAERLDRNTDAVNEGTNKDTHVHTGYVEQIYEDGEYRFSRWSTDESDSEYLRSKSDPNYQWGLGLDQDLIEHPDLVSNHHYHYDGELHILSHKVDEPRAYYESVGEPAVAVLREYRPLIDEAKVNTAVEPAPTDKKNDYIFFGQTVDKASYSNALGTVGSNLPAVIDASSRTSTQGSVGSYESVTHNVSDQTNRIWRAYGFYRSKADDAFHFNKAAWALHPRLTAIDFTGQHEPNHEWDNSFYDGTRPATQADVDAGNAENVGDPIRLPGTIFYPKVMDMPESLTSFNVDSNKDQGDYSNETYGRVTQNLLVYNNDEKTVGGADVFTYKEDKDESAESDVRYHNLVFNSSAVEPAQKFNTNYFHLVDKQDFNAPIEFAVNKRAWYERTPSKFRNVSGAGESYATPSAWEGITLPFTAKRVSASENKEISHFYGEIPAEGENIQTLHHEYWLTGMVAAAGDKATFARPSTADTAGEGLFVDAVRQEYATYAYPKNEYFTGLANYRKHYDSRDEDADDTFNGDDDEEWYLNSHNFADYVYLSKTVPYLIAFPGHDFYEFSVQGTNYDINTHSKSGNPQVVTFEHNGATTIAVSDDEYGERTTTIGSHNHIGTYLHEVDKYGVNATGSAFSTETGNVLPFRTYMNTTVGGSAAPRYIYIVDNGGDQGLDNHKKPADGYSGNVLKIWTEGHDIMVETSKEVGIKLYGISGVYMKTLDCKVGVNRFHQDKGGLYIVGSQKIMLKR